MGTTGSSEGTAMNTALPEIIARVREHATVPIAVGFGVASRAHFDVVIDAGADGVVIGSRIVSAIKNAPDNEVAKKVEAFCRKIAPSGQSAQAHPTPTSITENNHDSLFDTSSDSSALPPRFGQFGGQYVPEALFDCLSELERAHKSAMADPEFQKELRSHFGYMNRPSNLYLAENLTKDAGGARIWLKREDLYAFPPFFFLIAEIRTKEIIRDRIRSTMQ